MFNCIYPPELPAEPNFGDVFQAIKLFAVLDIREQSASQSHTLMEDIKENIMKYITMTSLKITQNMPQEIPGIWMNSS